MESLKPLFEFFASNYSWVFGGSGLIGAILAVWKIFLSKPSIHQEQTVSGGGKGYQAGGKLVVKKETSRNDRT